MNNKENIFFTLFFLISCFCFAQLDAEQFKKFEALTKDDELTINVDNYGCRVEYYTKYVFRINSKGYEIKEYAVMPSNTYVDGEKWSAEKLIKFEEEHGHFKLTTLTKAQYLYFIEELKQIVKSENSSAQKFAGDGVNLEIIFKGQTFLRKYRGWVQFESLPKNN
jgi:hypothetical protein